MWYHIFMSEVKLYRPEQLDSDGWRQLQALDRDSIASTLDRSQEEVDTLVDWGDPARYYTSHIDPNSEVGRRYYANQVYTRPRVAVATQANELIGFAYSAHNVSGGGLPEGPHNTSAKAELIRLSKRLSIVKNYLWIREIVVRPEYQRQGAAKQLGRTLLKDAIPFQPVATYIWPDEIDFLQSSLERLGFTITGEQPVKVFGEDKDPIRQVRLQAPSAR